MHLPGHRGDMLPIAALYAHDLTRRAVDGAGPVDPRLAHAAAPPTRGAGTGRGLRGPTPAAEAQPGPPGTIRPMCARPGRRSMCPCP